MSRTVSPASSATTSQNLFATLDSNWDPSAHRGRATLVSFAVQAFGLSLLVLIPLIASQGPPGLRWLTPEIFTPPSSPAPPAGPHHQIRSSNIREGQLVQPDRVPSTIANLDETRVGSAPDIEGIGVERGTGTGRSGVLNSIGNSVDFVPSPAPAPTHPFKISHWAEGNVIYRVQPSYPALAKQARVQGTVELRAIISKTGTIENLVVVRGHPMLSGAAIEAVRQWRYRPYLLNNEAVEVETEITVNFLLSGG
jgi:protein TonB